MAKICISGRYGMGNVGDELGLLTIIDAIRKYNAETEIVVFSEDTAETESSFKVRAVNCHSWEGIKKELQDTSFLICGGGNLLTEDNDGKELKYYLKVMKMAQKKNVPVYLFNQTVGPFKSDRTEKIIAPVLKKASKITVRDNDSAELLQKMGIRQGRIHVMGDPVFGLKDIPEEWDISRLGFADNSGEGGGLAYENREVEVEIRFVELPEDEDNRPKNIAALRPSAWRHPGEKLAGFIFSENSFTGGNELPVTQITVMADYLTDMGYKVIFLPLSYPADIKISRRILATMKGSGFCVEARMSPGSLVTAINALDFVFTSESYGVMLAAACRKPFAALCGDSRCSEIVKDLGIEPVAEGEDYDYEEFVANFKAAAENPDDLVAKIDENIEALIEKASCGEEQLTILMEQVQRHSDRKLSGSAPRVKKDEAGFVVPPEETEEEPEEAVSSEVAETEENGEIEISDVPDGTVESKETKESDESGESEESDELNEYGESHYQRKTGKKKGFSFAALVDSVKNSFKKQDDEDEETDSEDEIGDAEAAEDIENIDAVEDAGLTEDGGEVQDVPEEEEE